MWVDDTYEICDNNKIGIATYSTEEKALKVLDMLEEAIKGKSQTNWTSSNTRVIEHYNNIESLVFQMLQDSEV